MSSFDRYYPRHKKGNAGICVNEGYLPLGPQLGALDVAGQSEAVTCFHGTRRTIGVRVGAKF